MHISLRLSRFERDERRFRIYAFVFVFGLLLKTTKDQNKQFTVLTDEISIPDDDYVDKWINLGYWKRDKQTPAIVNMENKEKKSTQGLAHNDKIEYNAYVCS